MPRPIRIEYEYAYYHVMNYSRSRQVLFHCDQDYEVFLTSLLDASERFEVIIHGYCLFSTHYHLILQTPHGNLGRVMRHVNGVYTQYYNREYNTDGALFRGRYKAIVVEDNDTVLKLSRYIHRLPVEMKRGVSKKLEQHRWSSYQAFINKVKAPSWLYRDKIYTLLGQRKKFYGYKLYVKTGNDEIIEQFYNRKNISGVLGSRVFVKWIEKKMKPKLSDRVLAKTLLLSHSLTIKKITKCVANNYKLETKQLTTMVKGPDKGLMARKIAMYLCQQVGGFQLNDIMLFFGLSNRGSVSYITSQIRKNMKDDLKLEREINKLKSMIMSGIA